MNLDAFKQLIIPLFFSFLVLTSCTKEEVISDEDQEYGLVIDNSEVVEWEVLKWQNGEILTGDDVAIMDIRATKQMYISNSFKLSYHPSIGVFFTKEQVLPGYRYTAKVVPLKGDPQLSVQAYHPTRTPDHRLVKKDYRPKGMETLSFTSIDFKKGETKMYFFVGGATNTMFKLEVFSEKI